MNPALTLLVLVFGTLGVLAALVLIQWFVDSRRVLRPKAQPKAQKPDTLSDLAEAGDRGAG